ncbi:MAG TPA: hypothetical protein DCD97_06790 [Firmicutes bacterium]|nr:hypothetical protein [Bacillota bacterium]
MRFSRKSIPFFLLVLWRLWLDFPSFPVQAIFTIFTLTIYFPSITGYFLIVFIIKVFFGGSDLEETELWLLSRQTALRGETFSFF